MSLQEDVIWLKEWAASHDKRHVAEYERLTDALDILDRHSTNHHGALSKVKWGAVVAVLVAVLGVTEELVRRLLV